MKIIKALTISIFFSVITSSIVYPDTLKNPSVNIIDGYIGPHRGEKSKGVLSIGEDHPIENFDIKFRFNRLLGENKYKIENTDTICLRVLENNLSSL